MLGYDTIIRNSRYEPNLMFVSNPTYKLSITNYPLPNPPCPMPYAQIPKEYFRATADTHSSASPLLILATILYF
jgi:hypothetical protein